MNHKKFSKVLLITVLVFLAYFGFFSQEQVQAGPQDLYTVHVTVVDNSTVSNGNSISTVGFSDDASYCSKNNSPCNHTFLGSGPYYVIAKPDQGNNALFGGWSTNVQSMNCVSQFTCNLTFGNDGKGNNITDIYVVATFAPGPVAGQCTYGLAFSSTPMILIATNLCSVGTLVAPPTGSGPWQWNCKGLNGGGVSQLCSATLSTSGGGGSDGGGNTATDGACGTADSGSFSSAPTKNLCKSGTASSVSGSGPWEWTCKGINGGSDSSKCSATYKGALGGLVPCNNTPDGKTGLIPDGQACNFDSFITLVHNVINYIILLILPIAAIVIAYVGFLFLTSGGSSEVKTKAKGILRKVVIGLICIMAGWLIVNTILSAVGLQSAYNLLG